MAGTTTTPAPPPRHAAAETAAPAPAEAPGIANETALLAALFHALSDETRLSILARLCAGEQCVCSLTDFLSAGQSRLSFHLKTLKEAGLVTDRRQGRWVYYSLDPEALQQIVAFVKRLGCRPPDSTAEGGCCRR